MFQVGKKYKEPVVEKFVRQVRVEHWGGNEDENTYIGLDRNTSYRGKAVVGNVEFTITDGKLTNVEIIK